MALSSLHPHLLSLARRRLLAAATLLALSIGAASTACADTLPDLVERAKPSVLLVGSFGLLDSPRFGFRGTGFVVGDGRQAITNAHVLPPPPQPGSPERRLVVQLWTGEKQWSQREARLVALDSAHDLALLSFDGPPAQPLRLAEDVPPLREGSDVALIGFPLGGALGFSHVTHRGILAARTAIALPASASQALNARAVAQLRQGPFEVFQLDITAYPGNSGGPVFELASGAVTGIVSMVLVKGTHESALSAPSGISYAIPVHHARALLTNSR